MTPPGLSTREVTEGCGPGGGEGSDVCPDVLGPRPDEELVPPPVPHSPGFLSVSFPQKHEAYGEVRVSPSQARQLPGPLTQKR